MMNMTSRGNISWAIGSVVLLLVGSVFAGEITPREEGGNLIFENDEDGTYSSDITGTTGLVKNGTGNLTLTGSYSSSGAITVNTGTLTAPAGKFNGSTRPSVTVASGATFDVSGDRGSHGTWTTVFPKITIAGSGVNSLGALKRLSGSQLSCLTKTLELSDTALVNVGSTTGFGTVNLCGHQLVKKGSGTWHVISGHVVAGTDEASVSLDAGTLLMQNQYGFTGTDKNVMTANGLGTIQLSNMLTKEVPWALDVAESVTLTANTDNPATDVDAWSRWTGPITLSGTRKTLTLKSDANHALNIVGLVSGTAGGSLTISGGHVRFHDSVNLTQSGSWSGEINVSTDARAVFSGGTSGKSGEIVMSPGSTLEFADNGYFARRVGNGNYLRGTLAKPAKIVVTNSVFDSTCSTLMGDIADNCGIFEIKSEAVVSNHFVTANYDGGHAYGAVYQDGGSVYANSSSVLGRFAGTYGYWEMGGDRFWTSSSGVNVGEAGVGVVRLTADNSSATFQTSTGGGPSEVLLSGGTSYLTIDLCGADAPDGTMSLFALEGQSTTGYVGQLVFTGVNAVTGLVAVADGAVLKAARIMFKNDESVLSGHGALLLHANGGVLQQTYGYRWDGAIDKTLDSPIVVHEKGCVLAATADADCDIRFQLVAPTGYVVDAIALPTVAAFASDRTYVGPPVVKIEGAGSGAAAVAEFDRATRSITGIRVLSPGTGYAASGTIAKIASSDGTSEYTCAVSVKAAPTTGAGLAKRGSTFMQVASRNNTYHGKTSVEEGTLRFYFGDSIPAGSALAVAKGAVLNLAAAYTTPSIEGAGTITNVANGAITVTERVVLEPKRETTLTVTGPLNLSDGVALELKGTLPELAAGENLVLLEAKGGIQQLGDAVLPSLSADWRFKINQKTITLAKRRGFFLIVR